MRARLSHSLTFPLEADMTTRSFPITFLRNIKHRENVVQLEKGVNPTLMHTGRTHTRFHLSTTTVPRRAESEATRAPVP